MIATAESWCCLISSPRMQPLGSLVERLPRVLVVLPESLQAAYRSPESLGLERTRGREEKRGTRRCARPSLAAGGVRELVLQQGDTGHGHLPFLLGTGAVARRVAGPRAEHMFHADHGRIDVVFPAERSSTDWSCGLAPC